MPRERHAIHNVQALMYPITLQVQRVELPVTIASQSVVLVAERPAAINVSLEITLGITGPRGTSGDFFERSGIDMTITKSSGLISLLTYSDGYTLTFNRNPDNTLASVTGSDGKVKTLDRDGSGVLTGVTHTTP